MIIGGFEGRRPFLQGDILIPRFDLWMTVSFLVDTGADVTCLHPKDAIPADVPFGRLRNPTANLGIGGQSPYFVEQAILSFRDADSSSIYLYDVDLRIGKPEDMSTRIPSLLGQNVLQRWRMVHDPVAGRLEFQPGDAGYIIR